MAFVPPTAAAPASSTQSANAQSAIAQYDLAFQVSPIILVGGSFASSQGGAMPIAGLYGQLALLDGSQTDPNAFLARYLPMPGSTLISNQVGMYPFANQAVAANAIIVQPLTLSMRMMCPVNQPGGYLTKNSFLTSLQNALANHVAAAGTFSVATPAFVYNDLLLVGMTDISHGENQQQQTEWQLDFVQPLLTLAGAAAAQSNLMSKVSTGSSMPLGQSWSGNQQSQFPPVSEGLTGALATFGAYVPGAGGG